MRVFHVRYVSSTPENELRYGFKKKVRLFRQPFANIFKRNIADPARFLREGWSRNNLCLPMIVLMSFEYYTRKGSEQRYRPTFAEVENKLNCLHFTELLEKDFEGITLNKITKFEQINSPLSTRFKAAFPVANFYKGFSINVFRIDYSKQARTHRVFPLRLSENHQNNDFWNIDVLIDSEDFYSKKSMNDGEAIVTVTPPKHFLLDVG